MGHYFLDTKYQIILICKFHAKNFIIRPSRSFFAYLNDPNVTLCGLQHPEAQRLGNKQTNNKTQSNGHPGNIQFKKINTIRETRDMTGSSKTI